MKLFTRTALALGVAVSLFAGSALAGTVTNLNNCSTSAVTLTGAIPSALGNTPLPVGPLSTTSCYGVVTSPVNVGSLESADPNLGYLEDGLLNGETKGGTQYVPPYQFLTGLGGDVPQDLDNDGQVDDPGWIHLGGMGWGEDFDYSSAQFGSNTLNLEDVIQFNMTGDGKSGSWTLAVDKDIKAILEAVGIFNRSSFDHLAFVLKGGTGWAVYDFNFNDNLFSGFDLSQPYTLAGTWSTMDLQNNGGQQAGLSHMSLWARDPVSGNEVPTPGSLALVGLGLILVAGAVRARRQS